MQWKMNAGINHAPAYQVSGRPYITGSINAATATKISFPYVTRWIWINNRSTDAAQDVKIGFSEAAVTNVSGPGNYFILESKSATAPERGSYSPTMELKVSELWISGSNAVDIVAGLTSILPAATSMGDGLPNWSGSAGVG